MSELRAACAGRDLTGDGWPSVSVVVPVRNEGPHLERAVSSILSQQYPIAFDVCLAVAPSEDDTFEVARRLSLADERVSMVANRAGVTPAGLNLAIRATTGSILVRVDGHADLSDGYIRRAVETMVETGAVNVGGMQVPTPQTPFEEAVAAATTSWLGTGGASYRVGGAAGPVDTVYLGVFDRAAGDEVGWFDETLIRNQDYELNIRLRAAGGTVWFDPGLQVGYRPRGSWKALAEQYHDYGFWKAEVLRKHPASLKLRQMVPPLAVATVVISALVGVVGRRRWLLPAAGYLSLLAREGARHRRVRVAGVLAVMHVSWSLGLLRGRI